MSGFEFRDAWSVAADPVVVRDVLVDLEHYPAWWPQVVAVAKIDDDTARVLCRSTLPYTLDLVLVAVHRGPTLLETRIEGDLVGSVRWRISPDGSGTRLDFGQEVEVDRPVLRVAARGVRPLLEWNHHRMMAGCRTGLDQRLASAAS